MDFLSQPNIDFHIEDIEFQLQEPEKIIQWLSSCIQEENCIYQQLDFIFCSDSYLHQINLQYLEHDTYTDIITFDYSEFQESQQKLSISGDLFISIDRVQENAMALEIPFLQELLRVMIHGILHLCTYKDGTEVEEKIMRAKEDFYLKKMSNF